MFRQLFTQDYGEDDSPFVEPWTLTILQHFTRPETNVYG
jgi:hypothetical protein